MDMLKQSYAFGRSPLGRDAAAINARFYIFGGHIAQSLSPRLHGILFAARGVPWRFDLAQTTDADEFTETLHSAPCLGTSITMPNKIAFAARLDALTDEARAMGAVNTSFVRLDAQGRRRYVGANTDCIGIRDAILARVPDAATSARGRPAMVLGAGGAARSAVYALWRWLGASEIYVVNRLASEAEELIAAMQKTVPDLRLRYIAHVNDVAALAELPHIVVGTVPDAPPRDADEARCRAVWEEVLQRSQQGILLDMCYMPSPQTALYTTAAGLGWRVVSGTEVLARVCIAQHVLWLEQDVDEATVQRVVDAVGESVGQPGPSPL